MFSLFVLDIFSIIPLLFTISLAKKHILHSSKNIYYIAAACLTIVLLLLEVSVTILAAQSGAQFVFWHKLVNILGFALSPIVPYVILQFISNSSHIYGRRSLWILPMYANVVICIACYWKELIFTVNAQNQYIRGDLFFIPTLISVFYFANVCFEISKNRAKVSTFDKMMLFLIFLLPLASTAIQILCPKLLLIWPSIAMSLLLYYIYTLELQYDFDLQSQIKNRTAFEKHLKAHEHRKNATLFVFDLNNLKKTNDFYGHAEGDKLIKATAKMLHEHFYTLGEVFRIGGDEFCVVSTHLSDDEAHGILNHLHKELEKTNHALPLNLSLAYGFSHYNFHVDANISSALSRADDAMYAHKTQLKNLESET